MGIGSRRWPLSDEPRRHPIYLLTLAATILGTVPFAFAGKGTRILLGLPVWLWWSLSFTSALSALTAWGILRYWRDDRFD
jgi:hypothetical protein